jgi:hypothetical protein
MISKRPATKRDLGALMVAGVRFAEQVKAQPEHYTFAKGFDLYGGFNKLANCILKPDQNEYVYVIDGYMVFVSLVTPWYGGSSFMQEWFTIKIGDSVNGVNGVAEALHDLAKELGLAGVLGGDSSPVSIMAKAYDDSGYIPLTKVYFKGT